MDRTLRAIDEDPDEDLDLNNSDKLKTLCDLTLINTNARSLFPKLVSLTDCVNEMDTDVAIITETWLRDDRVDEIALDLDKGAGLDMLTKIEGQTVTG